MTFRPAIDTSALQQGGVLGMAKKVKNSMLRMGRPNFVKMGNLGQHPWIEFREPQYDIHVNLQDDITGETYWDAEYNLKGGRILPSFQIGARHRIGH